LMTPKYNIKTHLALLFGKVAGWLTLFDLASDCFCALRIMKLANSEGWAWWNPYYCHSQILQIERLELL
jgi:hypothetical protein